MARSVSDTRRMAGAQYGLGELARAEGNAKRAAVLHNEALRLLRQIGNAPGIAGSVALSADWRRRRATPSGPPGC